MRSKRFSCPNGCRLPPRRKVLNKCDDHKYRFMIVDFNYCPICGSLMPYSLEKVKHFFDVYNIHPDLASALNLVYKSEFTAAAREAFVVVETNIKQKSGLDAHGFDLATKALKFECDSKTGEITKAPLVAINGLKTESDRNEQEGIRYMLMGFFQGPRNLYQHNHIGSGAHNAISVIIQASFFLKLLDGQSISKNGRWIRSKTNFKDIYNNMPNPFDRLRLICTLKRRAKKDRMEGNETNET